jgi:acylphosphatase
MSKPSSPPEKVRVRVLISGTVQGVGYRYSTYNQANQIGISGWVRNLPDGRVEAVFEGTKEQVESMIRWCYQGSRGSSVSDVVVQYEQLEGLEDFRIIK